MKLKAEFNKDVFPAPVEAPLSPGAAEGCTAVKPPMLTLLPNLPRFSEDVNACTLFGDGATDMPENEPSSLKAATGADRGLRILPLLSAVPVLVFFCFFFTNCRPDKRPRRRPSGSPASGSSLLLSSEAPCSCACSLFSLSPRTTTAFFSMSIELKSLLWPSPMKLLAAISRPTALSKATSAWPGRACFCNRPHSNLLTKVL